MMMRFVTSLISLFLLSLSVFSQKLVADSSFAPALNGEVEILEILNDGKILIVGDFTTINGVGRKEIARLNADGSLDTTFNADWLAGQFNQGIEITAMKVLPDGKILVAGGLPFDGSCCSPRIKRLNADGSPDTTLTSTPFISFLDTGFVKISSVNQLPNGKIFMCGKFTLPNSNQKPYLARYNNDGTYDSNFATVIDNECQDVEVLPDGKYYLSSWSLNVNGTPRERLLRFNADDSVDTSFNATPLPGSDLTYYYKIKLLNDGTIMAFRATDTSERVTRFNPDGSLHTSFAASMDEPGDIAVQANGKVTVVGEYRLTFGQSTDLNRFNADGTHDPSLPRMGFFGSGFPIYPKAAAFAADGKLVVGGNFTSFNFITSGPQTNQPYLARFAPQAIPIKPKFDFDGDGKDDIAVFRPSDRIWYLNSSSAGFSATQFGLSTDIPIASDYDGDGKTDIAVFRDGAWYWLRSSDNVFAYKVCGQAGDIPTPAFNNGSGTTSFLVFRPGATPPQFYSQGAFQPNASPVEFRNMTLQATDKPVIGDYDGDGTYDLAIFRDGHWFFMKSNNLSTTHYQFGLAGDKPVVGDFDGDLRTDFAVYRPSEGIWYIKKSSEGFSIIQWGLADDIPVPADYDGDGKTDIAVYRPSDGVWYQLRSTGSYHIEPFGLSGDVPAQAR